MAHVRLAMLLALALSAARAAPVQASDASTVQWAAGKMAPENNSRARKYVTANSAGLVVVVDRATGDMRALTAEESQRLAQGLKELVNQSTDGLVQVQHADGSVSMDLQGHFQNVMLAKKEDDGTISQACVDNVDDAAAFFEIDPALVNATPRNVGQPPAALDIQ